MKRCTICGEKMELVKWNGAWYYKWPVCKTWEEYE